MKFAREVTEPRIQARAAIAEKNAKTLAAEILAMGEDEFRMAFGGSAIKRAKQRGIERNAAVLRSGLQSTEIERDLTDR